MKWLIVMCLIVSISCEKKTIKTQEESDITRAHRLIDDGKSDEALDILFKLREKESDNQDVLVAISSAYVRKAGIRVGDFFKFAKALQTPESLKNQTNDQRMLKSTEEYVAQNKDLMSTEVSSSLLSLIKTLSTIQEFNQLLKTLPSIDESQAADIERALLNLQQIKKIDAGPALYRAVIRLVLVKYDIDHRIYPNLLQLKGENCTLDFEHLQSGTRLLHYSMVNVATDLIISFPSRKEDLSGIISSLDGAQDAVMGISGNVEELNSRIDQLMINLKSVPGIDLTKCKL